LSQKEFIEEFIQESKEQLTALSQGLLALEKKPGDRACIDRIFRAAHTLKGNAATMGFSDISELAHKMEALLEAVRKGRAQVTGELIELLLEALDLLEAMVDSAGEGVSFPEASELSARLETALSEAGGEGQRGRRPLKVSVVLREGERLKSVRAFMVLRKLDERGRVIRAEPELGRIEKGELERGFAVVLETDAPEEELEAEIGKVAGVESCKVVEEKPGMERQTRARTVQTVRVRAEKLDGLVDLAGEMVIGKGRLVEIARGIGNEELKGAVHTFARLSKELQDLSLRLRMLSLEHIYKRFPRMVRDLARKSGKEVELTMEGGDIELDRTVLDRIGEPLMHVLRNAVDHGIETPAEREKAGKPGKGMIRLKAARVKDHVEIAVEDDGRGIDVEEVKSKAVEKGLVSRGEAQEMDQERALDLIFLPGFSSKEEVTEVSGRGVGLDAVKDIVSRLSGTVTVATSPGKGTKVTLSVPLSLAIIKALLVEVGAELYAIPTKDVLEVVALESVRTERAGGREMAVLRDEPMLLLRLGEMLGAINDGRDSKIVVVERAGRRIALGVERILRQEEVVVKALAEPLNRIPGISGATILGDGRVVLILDVYSLI